METVGFLRASVFLWTMLYRLVSFLLVGKSVEELPKLSVRKVEAIKDPGMYADGDGLYLCVAKGGTKSWIVRATVKGRLTQPKKVGEKEFSGGEPLRVEIGIGSVRTISLAEAREVAAPLVKAAKAGVHPRDARIKPGLTFEEATHKLYEHLRPTWRSERHAKLWISSMQHHVFPSIGNRRIDGLATSDLLSILQPIWVNKNDTAARLKQRMTAVFDWAKGAGHYERENPANGLRKALAPVRPTVKHMAALPWQNAPRFWECLGQREGTSAQALKFLILTAARSGEVRGARWSEIDGDVWSVPGARMKSGLLHRVPLTQDARSILETVRGLDQDLIFPSPSKSKERQARPMSDMVFKALMDRMEWFDLTTHGFRSTFRDWCSESAHADREVAEAALSHTLGNQVERAYARSDLFERRAKLMALWSQYVSGQSGIVVSIARAK